MNSLVENGDGMSIDDQLATLSLHLALEAAVGGVILEHVDLKVSNKCKFTMLTGSRKMDSRQKSGLVTHHVLQVNEGVVDGHNLHLLGGESSTSHQTTDTAESGEPKT